MKNSPRFLDDKNMRHVNLSTALFFQGLREEALNELDKVHTKNKEIKAIVDKSIKTISKASDDHIDTKDS